LIKDPKTGEWTQEGAKSPKIEGYSNGKWTKDPKTGEWKGEWVKNPKTGEWQEDVREAKPKTVGEE